MPDVAGAAYLSVFGMGAYPADSLSIEDAARCSWRVMLINVVSVVVYARALRAT